MDYHVIRKLSDGGFSEIFEVRDPQSVLREPLILKRLSPEMSRRPEVRSAFAREGQILSELRYPNIVTFRRCYYDGDRICLVMEKVDGMTFNAWIREGGRQPEAVLDAFRQILEAVDHLHHRPCPLLHLDLKPENILMQTHTSGVRPVLIDFGIARDQGTSGLKAYTPPYAAPEQVRGGQLGCFTDVYALGQILHEVLDLHGARLGPERTAALRRVVRRARSPARRRRFADAGEMLRALRAALVSRPEADPLPWKTLAALAAAVVVAVGLGGAAWTLLRPQPERPAARELTPPEEPTLAAEPAPPGPEACLQLESLGTDDVGLSRELDRCIRLVLQSNDLKLMNAQYLAAKAAVERRSLDAATQAALERQLDELKLRIDARTVARGF